MKMLYFLIILSSFLFSQLNISIDSNGILNNIDMSSGVSISYDRPLLKQENIKLGIGLEYMFPRDSKDGAIDDL